MGLPQWVNEPSFTSVETYKKGRNPSSHSLAVSLMLVMHGDDHGAHFCAVERLPKMLAVGK